jgi:hypothetical protein
MFNVGDAVRYYSLANDKWLHTHVLAARRDGLYDLECKSGAEPEKVIAVRRLSERSSLGSTHAQSCATVYAVGDHVDYFSRSKQKWISTTVVEINFDGTYSLTCKTGAMPSEIIRSSAPAYVLSDHVDYFSRSKQKWISTTVVKVNSDGTYDLKCKTGVMPSEIARAGDHDAPEPIAVAPTVDAVDCSSEREPTAVAPTVTVVDCSSTPEPIAIAPTVLDVDFSSAREPIAVAPTVQVVDSSSGSETIRTGLASSQDAAVSSPVASAAVPALTKYSSEQPREHAEKEGLPVLLRALSLEAAESYPHLPHMMVQSAALKVSLELEYMMDGLIKQVKDHGQGRRIG